MLAVEEDVEMCGWMMELGSGAVPGTLHCCTQLPPITTDTFRLNRAAASA